MQVCKCHRTGYEDEYHIRYQGLTKEEAQEIASAINSGALAVWREMRRLDSIDRMEAAAYHLERAAHYMRPAVSLFGPVHANAQVTP